MEFYEAETTIAAKPDAVWKVLVDGANWPQWDSGVNSVDGTIALGNKITIKAAVGGDRAFPVKVVTFDAPKSLVFSGGMPLGLFRGVRTYTLTPQAPGRSSTCARNTPARCWVRSGSRFPTSARHSHNSSMASRSALNQAADSGGDPFDALADRNRREILRLLGSGDRAVHELADELPISRPAVSRHLRLLSDAGLVTEKREGTRRIYSLRDEGVAAVHEYLERVWGEAATRFRIMAENTHSRDGHP